MTAVDNSKVYDLVTVDPNFSLPTGVADLGYTNPDDKADSSIERSNTTGQIINIDYDEAIVGEGDFDGNVGVGSGLLPPDFVNVVSQVVRVTSDGRVSVDVILEVEDLPGVTGYEVGLTKT